MNLVETTLLSGLSYGVRLMTGLISTKIIAVYLGAPGIALTAHFANVIALAFMLTNGVNTAVTKYVSEYYDDTVRRQQVLQTSFTLVVLYGAAVSLAVVIFARSAAVHILKSADLRLVVVVVGCLVAVPSVNNYYLSVLNGLKQIRQYLGLNIASACAGLVCTVALVPATGLAGALVAQPLAQGLILVGVLAVGRKQPWFRPMELFRRLDPGVLPLFLRFSVMVGISTVASNVALLIVREQVIDHLSVQAAGYWQGMMRLSDAYMSIIVSSLTIYYLPRLSEIKSDRELRKELFHGYRLIVPAMIALAVTVFLLRDYVIRFLYTAEFAPMRQLFPFQLVGDVLKMSAWLLGYITVAKAMTTRFIICEVAYNVVFVCASTLLLRRFGVIGITYAYVLGYVFLLVLLLVMFRSLIWPGTENAESPEVVAHAS